MVVAPLDGARAAHSARAVTRCASVSARACAGLSVRACTRVPRSRTAEVSPPLRMWLMAAAGPARAAGGLGAARKVGRGAGSPRLGDGGLSFEFVSCPVLRPRVRAGVCLVKPTSPCSVTCWAGKGLRPCYGVTGWGVGERPAFCRPALLCCVGCGPHHARSVPWSAAPAEAPRARRGGPRSQV